MASTTEGEEKTNTREASESTQGTMAAVAERLRSLNRMPALSIHTLVFSKLLMVALPIAQISIGATYLKECPQQNFIPVYLVVCGVFSISLVLLACLPCGQKDNTALKCLGIIFTSLVSVFTFCWFIAGCVWIYSIYPPNYTSTKVGQPYCNKTLYLFAFWTTTLVYILLAMLLVGLCCIITCMCACMKSKVQSEEVAQAPELEQV